MMNKIIYFVSLLILSNISCVSPPEYSDGLLENNPAIINESDIFSLSIYTEDYTENEIWDLNFSLVDSDILLSTLIIKDLNISSTDSSNLVAVSEEKMPTINGRIVFAESTTIAKTAADIGLIISDR